MKPYVMLLVALLAIPLCKVQAQKHPSSIDSIYNPNANAEADLKAAIKKAAVEKKHVLIQVGGNWCIWCRRLYKYVEDRPELKQLVDNNYVVYHLNYSKENENLPILAKLGYPQRFGFPVLVVLDSKGNRLHTQDSGLLESGNDVDWYDVKKLANFYRNWSPGALHPANYEK